MTAVVGRAWGWLSSWKGSSSSSEGSQDTKLGPAEGQTQGGIRGWTSWVWGGWRHSEQHSSSSVAEEFWEAQEKIQPMGVEDLCAGKQDTTEAHSEHVSRWWNKYLPGSSYLPWPRSSQGSGLRQKKHDGWSGDADAGGDMSDYGTPPPSPTPPSSSPFRLFVNSWKVDVQPEHHDICFNFLRHLFDLFVVGFLWTVSPPTKLVLEVLGVQGALRLWLHGMAMFFVSTVGMAGLLWLVQEYLPQFTLLYGIIQAVVISVSVRQSVLLGGGDMQEEGNEMEEKETDGDVMDSSSENKEKLVSVMEKVKTS